MKLGKKDKKQIAKALAFFTQIGITIFVTIIVCFFIGRAIDNFFETSPVFLLIFLFLAILASLRSIYVMAKDILKD